MYDYDPSKGRKQEMLNRMPNEPKGIDWRMDKNIPEILPERLHKNLTNPGMKDAMGGYVQDIRQAMTGQQPAFGGTLNPQGNAEAWGPFLKNLIFKALGQTVSPEGGMGLAMSAMPAEGGGGLKGVPQSGSGKVQLPAGLAERAVADFRAGIQNSPHIEQLFNAMRPINRAITRTGTTAGGMERSRTAQGESDMGMKFMQALKHFDPRYGVDFPSYYSSLASKSFKGNMGGTKSNKREMQFGAEVPEETHLQGNIADVGSEGLEGPGVGARGAAARIKPVEETADPQAGTPEQEAIARETVRSRRKEAATKEASFRKALEGVTGKNPELIEDILAYDRGDITGVKLGEKWGMSQPGTSDKINRIIRAAKAAQGEAVPAKTPRPSPAAPEPAALPKDAPVKTADQSNQDLLERLKAGIPGVNRPASGPADYVVSPYDTPAPAPAARPKVRFRPTDEAGGGRVINPISGGSGAPLPADIAKQLGVHYGGPWEGMDLHTFRDPQNNGNFEVKGPVTHEAVSAALAAHRAKPWGPEGAGLGTLTPPGGGSPYGQ